MSTEKLQLSYIPRDANHPEGMYSLLNESGSVIAVIAEDMQNKDFSRTQARLFLYANEIYEYAKQLTDRIEPLMEHAEDQLILHCLSRLKHATDAVKQTG